MCNRFANYQNWGGAHRGHCGPGKHHRRRRAHRMRRFGAGWLYPPANVQEFDDRYELQVFAPGLTKEDFSIGVADGVLIIKADPKSGEDSTNADNWRRKEFAPEGFKRRFELNDGINTEAISAKYTDGVLLVTLPKLDDHHTQRHEVTVE